MNRRFFISTSLATLTSLTLFGVTPSIADHGILIMVDYTEDEWKQRLTDKEFYVLRKEGTEHAFTSPLNDEKREGIFACKGCDLPLFKSEHKYNSGTGWPSFFQEIDGHIETKIDFKLILPRTEYHCARCGGHQGHVFKDGPEPTGLRYCNNGIALKFIPKDV